MSAPFTTRQEQLNPDESLTFDTREAALDWAASELIADKTRTLLINKKADRAAQLLLEMDNWEEPCYESIEELPINRPNWLISDYIEQGTVGFLSGIFGSAKSFLALDWACCVATGTSWWGHTAREGKVMYIAAEGVQGVGRRYAAWRKENRSVSPEDMDVILSPVQFGYQPAVDWLIKRVREFKADFLIIDTLARSTSGLNENDAIDMGKVVDAMYALRDARDDDEQTTVLMVHHSGWGDQSRSRGSSRLPSDTDFSYTTTRGDGTKPFTLKCTKLKEDRLPDTFNFNLSIVEVAEGITSCVIQPAEQQGTSAGAPDTEPIRRIARDDVLDALRERDGQTNKELAEGTGHSVKAVSDSTTMLRELGKIRGQQSESDGRSWLWYLAGNERSEVGKLAGGKKPRTRF